MLVIVFLFQLQYFIFVVNKKESISFNELIKKKKNSALYMPLNIRFHLPNQLPKIATEWIEFETIKEHTRMSQIKD